MAQAKVNRKQEKKMKENLLMLDDERRHADQYKEQAEKVSKNCSSNVDDYVKHSHCTCNCMMAQIATEWMTYSLQVNGRIKALKRQLDELEEEVSREKAQRRKVQRELEDLVADNESKEREITNLKNKLRYGPPFPISLSLSYSLLNGKPLQCNQVFPSCSFW